MRGRRHWRLAEHLLGRATPARAGPTPPRTATVTASRSYPARAGPTPTDHDPRAPLKSYPRSRGADDARNADQRIRDELPPLARGRPSERRLVHQRRGATPARTGPTRSAMPQRRSPESYPRSRGADRDPDRQRLGQMELPPLAPGRLLLPRVQTACVGATPARAGPTTAGPDSGSLPASYPRSRRADSASDTMITKAWELPPLARGRQAAARAGKPDRGATPARAGPTSLPRSLCRCTASYPRSRGADRPGGMSTPAGGELPPLARGRRHDDRDPEVSEGATPARAGPTRPCD